MVPQVRDESEPVKAPVPKLPFSVVVAVSPPESAELVPQAKPRTVALAPPVAVILPFTVAEVAAKFVSAWVVTVGAARPIQQLSLLEPNVEVPSRLTSAVPASQPESLMLA